MITKLLSIYRNIVAERSVDEVEKDLRRTREDYHYTANELNQLRLVQERTDREVDALRQLLTAQKAETKRLLKTIAERDSRIAALGEAVQSLNNRPVPENKVEIPTFVMTEKMYRDLQKDLEPPIVTNNTTAHGCGYLLGMQRVLSKLEERYVSR
ncbi:hypothetical protein Villemi_00030 [Pseudomonas phage vB_PpuP-Villemi]